MPELDFENIDFEKIPTPIEFTDIDFEGTDPIAMPEIPRKEPFLAKVKDWLKPSPEEETAEDIFTNFITKEQKEPPGLTHYKGAPVFTPEREMEYARKYPNLMAARYALASLLPFGHLAASPTEEEAFKQLPENEQALRFTGELAAWAIMPPAIGWLMKTGAKAIVGKFPWMAKPILNALKEATWFRRLTNKERGLVVETISDMKNAGLNDAQILKNLRNRNSTEYKSYFQEAVRKRTTGEVPPITPEEPVIPPIKPEPPPVKKPKVETEIAKQFREVIAAERKAPPLTVLEARELEIKKGEIDFEKVEALPEPKIVPEKAKVAPRIEVKEKVIAKPKAVKKAPTIPDTDIITWIKGTGGVREATLPGELKDLITDVDIKGKFKRAKGIPVGFLNDKTGRGFDEIVDEARSADFDVRDESHLIELIERTQRAVMEGKPEEKVRPLTDETLTDKMWSDYIKEEMKDGVSEREAKEALERESTDEIAKENEFARLEREAIQNQVHAVTEEIKPAFKPTKTEELQAKITALQKEAFDEAQKIAEPWGEEFQKEYQQKVIQREDQIKAYGEQIKAEFAKQQQKYDTIDLFSGFPLHKVDKAILEPLRNLYMKAIGDPLWNFLAETLPVEAGKRSRFADAINKGLIWDYRKDPKFVELRDDTHMKIQQYREKAKEIAEVMAKFSRAEQIRIAQIIKGGVTAAPKRYESAFEAIKRFQELEKDLQDLGILGLDNRFRQLTRREIATKFREIKESNVQIEKLRKRLQPIEKIGKVARSISEDVSEQIVSTSETEGMYEVKETKWTGLNEGRIKEALISRGFGEGEATQMISRVKESVVPLEGKTGTLKEIRTNVEKIVTKTIIQEIIKTRTYHPAMMARARGAIIKDINKLANKRDEILERIRLHYKMSGKLYLRRAYEKIENEKTFLRGLINLLKIRKTRLKKGYEIRRKDLSSYYRETVLGEIKKAPYLVFKGLSEESHDVELMRMFMNISKNKDWAISPEEWTNIQALKARHHLIPKYENFKPLPVTEKLGPLSGALVDPYIWDDLNEAVKIRNEMIKAWDTVLSLWKVGKAVYNPATQCRNILSNSILADFADLPQHRIDIYARAALEFYTKSGYWKEAKENTPLMGTEWAATEAMEFLKAASKLKEGSWLVESAKLAAKYLDMPGKMYQFWEQFFKLAVYTNERENGASIKAAYQKAEKYIFNYQKIPSAIRWAKRWWSPFITFSYKAIPRFAETVVRKPWKIVKYGLLMAGVEEITRRMLGESKEQMDREKRVLPDYMRKSILPGQLSHLRVFYRDKYGRSKYLDLSFILPWGDIAEQWGQSFLVGRPFLPNHPFYVFVAEVAFNEIFFTGQELTDKELDEGLPYWKKLGTQLWRQAMPSLAGSYGWNKLMAAYKGERDWALRDRSMTEAIFDVFFGLKIRSIDYNESHARRITQLTSKIDLAKERFSKDYWKIVTNPTPDPDYDMKRQEKLYIRLNKDIDKIIEKITEIER